MAVHWCVVNAVWIRCLLDRHILMHCWSLFNLVLLQWGLHHSHSAPLCIVRTARNDVTQWNPYIGLFNYDFLRARRAVLTWFSLHALLQSTCLLVLKEERSRLFSDSTLLIKEAFWRSVVAFLNVAFVWPGEKRDILLSNLKWIYVEKSRVHATLFQN